MKTGDHIDKPWGWEEILDLNDRYCIKHLFINGGHRLSKQYHERKSETLILTQGAAQLVLSTDGAEHTLDMETSKPYPITPGTIHRLKGISTPGALILEVSTPELDDVVRLEDDYDRSGS